VAEFLLEFYVAQTNALAVERNEKRTRVAADELTREGSPVRFLRSIVIPEDETCFYLCEAASVDAVRQLAKRAGLPVGRVVEAVGTDAAGRSAKPRGTKSSRQTLRPAEPGARGGGRRT
jgi:hypothetical protein